MAYNYPGGRPPGRRPSRSIGYGQPVGRANFDLHGESFPVEHANAGQVPTLADYDRLAQAYVELKEGAEKQQRLLEDAQQAIDIRDDLLKKQGEELKQRISEVAFLKAITAQRQRDEDNANAKAGKGANAEEWQERYLRLQAEMENLRRRFEQRAATESAEARRAILRDMLPLADHLELALQHGSALEGEAAKGFVGSIEATYRAFLETLRRYGVAPIEAEGTPFDPALHEAVGMIPLANAPAGTQAEHVAHVVQRGYLDGETLLRPARVLVAAE